MVCKLSSFSSSFTNGVRLFGVCVKFRLLLAHCALTFQFQLFSLSRSLCVWYLQFSPFHPSPIYMQNEMRSWAVFIFTDDSKVTRQTEKANSDKFAASKREKGRNPIFETNPDRFIPPKSPWIINPHYTETVERKKKKWDERVPNPGQCWHIKHSRVPLPFFLSRFRSPLLN